MFEIEDPITIQTVLGVGVERVGVEREVERHLPTFSFCLFCLLPDAQKNQEQWRTQWVFELLIRFGVSSCDLVLVRNRWNVYVSQRRAVSGQSAIQGSHFRDATSIYKRGMGDIHLRCDCLGASTCDEAFAQ